MKDEQYVYIQDLKEKKTIGRGSFNKRTHVGGSGKKKWAAELMSNKELAKMNGELKTYRLNDPMTWAEFRALPDDIKKMYINAIRERFNPCDSAIAQMLGTDPSTFLKRLKRLGLPHGSGKLGKEWDRAGFEAWAKVEKPTEAYQSLPKPTEEAVTEVTEVTEETEEKNEVKYIECPTLTKEDIKRLFPTRTKAIPKAGKMEFEGTTENIVEAIASLLGGAEVRLTITWGIKVEGDEW